MSAWSPANMMKPMPSWRILLVHLMRWALALAPASAGSSIAARMAMMAITTNNSISVKPCFFWKCRTGIISSGWFGLLEDDLASGDDIFFPRRRRRKFHWIMRHEILEAFWNVARVGDIPAQFQSQLSRDLVGVRVGGDGL